jgi:hypothetical protein
MTMAVRPARLMFAAMDVRIDEAAAWADFEHEAARRVAVGGAGLCGRKMRK